ncbi:MAG: aldo/keto reductase [Porticoccaceae bacterium]
MKLAIGTAQFGMNYGVSNPNGVVSLDEITKILEYGKSVGINFIDTAAAYGNAELVLGKVGINDWKCVTKLRPIDSIHSNVEDWVKSQVNLSLEKLKVSHLHGILLHKPSDIIEKNGKAYIRSLIKLKELGIIENIGVSIYSPDELDDVTKIFWPDIVQVPYNIFDNRINTSGWLDKLKSRDVKVHARSIFLQGLLLMDKNKRPKYFDRWKSPIGRWDELVEGSVDKALRIALSYVMQDERVEKVIVGINSLPQLKELVQAEPIEISSIGGFEISDLELIEPYRWTIK